MTALSPQAEELRAGLLDLEPDDRLALPLPHGMPDAHRRAFLLHVDRTVAELRAAGWQLQVARHGRPDGDVMAIAVLAAPPHHRPHDSGRTGSPS